MELSFDISKILKSVKPDNYIENTIPVFSEKNLISIKNDKYESIQHVDFYTVCVAFAYIFFNKGYTETLYRTINSYVFSKYSKNDKFLFGDFGCGVGRTLYDLSKHFTSSSFIGLDFSYNMLIRAKQILQTESIFEINLNSRGFQKYLFKGEKRNNINLIQGDIQNLPFVDNIFDCITNTYLIDRVENIDLAIKETVRVLKIGGYLILTDPLNFEDDLAWNGENKPQKLIEKLQDNKIEIEEWYDDLLFSYPVDKRGNYRTWKTLLIIGKKST